LFFSIKIKLFVEVFLSLALLVLIVIAGWLVWSRFLVQTPKTAQAQRLNSNSPAGIIFDLTNIERQKVGLGELRISDKLTQAATNKQKEMLEKSYFSHIDSNNGKKWSEFIIDSGYDYSTAGENLARNFSNPKDIVEAWMNSPTHRENILDKKFQETGISVEKASDGGLIVVQMFGGIGNQ